MKAGPWILGLQLLLGAVPILAQPHVAQADARARIEAERERIRGEVERQERACYQNFSVNSCLLEVKAWRRRSLEALQRDEDRLDDEARRQRGAEQLRRIDEKAAARPNARAEQDRAARARQAYEDKQARARRKQVEAGQRTRGASGAKSHAPDRTETPPPADNEPQAAAARQAYEEKLRQREERRKRRDRLLEQKRGTRAAQPLPVPD